MKVDDINITRRIHWHGNLSFSWISFFKARQFIVLFSISLNYSYFPSCLVRPNQKQFHSTSANVSQSLSNTLKHADNILSLTMATPVLVLKRPSRAHSTGTFEDYYQSEFFHNTQSSTLVYRPQRSSIIRVLPPITVLFILYRFAQLISRV